MLEQANERGEALSPAIRPGLDRGTSRGRALHRARQAAQHGIGESLNSRTHDELLHETHFLAVVFFARGPWYAG